MFTNLTYLFFNEFYYYMHFIIIEENYLSTDRIFKNIYILSVLK